MQTLKSNSNLDTQSPVNAVNGIEDNKDSGQQKRLSSHEEQVQGSKTSMSDLVGEAIDRNATNSFRFAKPLQRGRTYTFHRSSLEERTQIVQTKNPQVAGEKWRLPAGFCNKGPESDREAL